MDNFVVVRAWTGWQMETSILQEQAKIAEEARGLELVRTSQQREVLLVMWDGSFSAGFFGGLSCKTMASQPISRTHTAWLVLLYCRRIAWFLCLFVKVPARRAPSRASLHLHPRAAPKPVT